MLAAVSLTLAIAAGPTPLDLAPFDVVKGYVDEMRAAEAASTSVTMVMHKRERVGGSLRPRERMAVKFAKPHAVYVKWVGEVNQGREVLWRRGWNAGELRARNGLFVLNLDPDGGVAMMGQRHPITRLGFAYMVKRIVDDTKRMSTRPERDSAYTLLPDREVHGAKAVCWRAELPKDKEPSLYGYRSEICMDRATKMPVLLKIWDREGGEIVLVEEYSYSEVKLNPGLSKRDFDPDNPAYNF